ncbi:MAG: transcriptional regulator [Gammaproteobacteria bacterium RIFCSPHIGHO2_12_FULL_35_23]|nr:MAG: transcriptional regulator [Gammaproteobacteria bacterium RIFCSPHIGHO2_12_FULL_35_23]
MGTVVETLADLEFLSKLMIGIGEVAEITRIPARQLRYWEEKGIIHALKTKRSTTRRYDYQTVKKIILIKELLEEGYTLKAATKKIATRLEKINTAFNKLKKD